MLHFTTKSQKYEYNARVIRSLELIVYNFLDEEINLHFIDDINNFKSRVYYIFEMNEYNVGIRTDT